MLDTFQLICRRESTQALREKPVKNSSGDETTFTPTTHRFEDTMQASYECRNGPEMETSLEESREKDEAERLRRANQEIAAGQLEIKNDLRHLRKQISNLMMIISGSCLIQRRTRTLSARLTGGETSFILDDEEMSHEIVRHTLSQFEEMDADYLGVANANELAQEFVADMNLNEADIKSKLENETGKATLKYIKSISNEWVKLLTLITVHVFEIEDERAAQARGEAAIAQHLERLKERKAEAAIAKAFGEWTNQNATLEAKDALDEVDEATKLSIRQSNAIRKACESEAKKAVKKEIHIKRREIFGGCRGGKPSIKARKEWSRLSQYMKRQERAIAEQTYNSIIEKLKVSVELTGQGQEREREHGQEREQEHEQTQDIVRRDQVNSKQDTPAGSTQDSPPIEAAKRGPDKERQEALQQGMGQQRRHMHQADEQVSNVRREFKLKQKYGSSITPAGDGALPGSNLNYYTKPSANKLDPLMSDMIQMSTFDKNSPEDQEPEIIDAPIKFEGVSKSEQPAVDHRKKLRSNMTYDEPQLMLTPRNGDTLIAISADKTLEPGIAEREVYMEEYCMKHLGNEHSTNLNYLLHGWLSKYNGNLPDKIEIISTQTIDKYDGNRPRFRVTAKENMLHMIICCEATTTNRWSCKWLSFYVSKLTRHANDIYVEEPQLILSKTREIQLPPHAWQCTASVNSMYDYNIDADHAIKVISQRLDDEIDDMKQPPEGFRPLEASHFAEDIYGIWNGNSLIIEQARLGDERDHKYVQTFVSAERGIREHAPTSAKREYNYVQAIASAERRTDYVQESYRHKIESPNNFLYLNLPPTSTHPPGYIESAAYDLIGRYNAKITYQQDHPYSVQMLYKCLPDRDWERQFIRDQTLDALSKIETKGPKGSESSHPATNNDRSLSQTTYHPDDIPNSRIHELHQEHRRELSFTKLDATEGQTITYSNSSPPNFGNYVTKTKLLHQEPDHRASIILGEQYKSEMDWILCFPKNFLSVPFRQLRWLPSTERKFYKNFSKLFSIF